MRNTKTLAQDKIYRSLAHRRRRQILAIVMGRGGSIAETTLATQLTAENVILPKENVPPDEIPDEHAPPDEKTSVLVDLRHVHLPLLDDAGLIQWNTENRIVSVTDHLLHNSTVKSIVEMADESANAVLSALSHQRRRFALSVVQKRHTPIDSHSLARAIANLESAEEDFSDEQRREIHASLHHVHLPLLDETGFIDFDHEADTIAHTGYPSDKTGEIDADEDESSLPKPVEIQYQCL